jgi:phage protein U
VSGKKKIRKGWLIIRVSDEKQAITQSGSLQAQEARGKRFIASKNEYSRESYEVIKVIQEEQSAFREKNAKRIEFQLLIKAIKLTFRRSEHVVILFLNFLVIGRRRHF